MSKPQAWMLFQAHIPGNNSQLQNVFYFWNGTWPIVVFDGDGLSTNDTAWNGIEGGDISEIERVRLSEAAATGTIRTFTIHRRKQKFKIIKRGIFPEI